MTGRIGTHRTRTGSRQLSAVLTETMTDGTRTINGNGITDIDNGSDDGDSESAASVSLTSPSEPVIVKPVTVKSLNTRS